MTTIDDVMEALKDVVDPELGINVVDLGLVYGVHLDGDTNAVIDMTLTSAACPLTDVIEDQTRQALEGLVNDFRINWVWMPPWGPDKIAGRPRAAACPRLQRLSASRARERSISEEMEERRPGAERRRTGDASRNLLTRFGDRATGGD